MRYFSVDTLSFNDKNGKTYAVKDIRSMTILSTGVVVELEEGMQIDELISRPGYYGNDSEGLSYLVVDHNAEKLAENNFDLSKLKTLKIPILSEI